MAEIIDRRVCAEIDGPFVVFLIGMRVNRWWKPWKYIPVFRAMARMLPELARDPGLGLLHARAHFGFPNVMLVQYWRSYAALEAYATARNLSHLPAWAAFNTAVGTNGDVGIWHETYCIAPGTYENVYGNMPAFGLGMAGNLQDATGPRARAMGRMRHGASEN
jgi:hypothetical protein